MTLTAAMVNPMPAVALDEPFDPMVGTLLALVLALTLGLFGIHETLHFQLVPTTLVVESVGTVILVVTTAQVRRLHRAR